MPTPEGREWLSSDQIAARMMDKLNAELPAGVKKALDKHPVIQMLKDAYISTEYTYEFKILRLVEKVKNAMGEGTFGPLVIPNSVDVNGEQIPTPVGVVYFMLKDIYTPEFLDMFDEEGNLLPEAGE